MRKSVFSGHSCQALAQARLRQVAEEVSALTKRDIEGDALERTAERLYKKYDLPPAVIDKDGVTVSGESTLVEFHVPFQGEGEFFNLSPSYANVLDNVRVDDSSISFRYHTHGGSPQQVRSRFDSDLKRFEDTLTGLTKECEALNENLRGHIQRTLELRAQELREQNKFIDDLGFPRK